MNTYINKNKRVLIIAVIAIAVVSSFLFSNFGKHIIQNITTKNIQQESTATDLVVKCKSGIDYDLLKKTIQEKYSKEIKSMEYDADSNMLYISCNTPQKAKKVLKDVSENSQVDYAQPDYILYQSTITDTDFGKQWGLENNGQIVQGETGRENVDINLLDAWSIATGRNDIIVGVLDSGIDINNVELSNNIYNNTNEECNGIDTDENGYVDDINGWNFLDDNNNVTNTSILEKHGTYISGIIAASNDGKGVTGIAPNVKLLPLKFMDENGGKTSDAIRAIEYAKSLGVKVINCSFNCNEYNRALYEEMMSSNILFVCAAGNYGVNLENAPNYPASFDLDNVITVGAINNVGQIAKFSDYGNNVDIAAPGVNIYLTAPNNTYEYASGTSLSAAFVSGSAALLFSTDISLLAKDAKTRIINNAKKSNLLTGKVGSNGRMDAYATLINTPATIENAENITIDNDVIYSNMVKNTTIENATENTNMMVMSETDDDEGDIPYIETHLADNDVDVSSGVLQMQFTDMKIDGYYPEISIKRLYQSKPTKWSFNFDSYAERYYKKSGLYRYRVTLPNGSTITFRYDSKTNKATADEPINYFTVKAESCNDIYIKCKDNFIYYYHSSDYTRGYYLNKIIDLNGNSLNIEYTNNIVTGLVDYKNNHYTITKDSGNCVSIVNNTTFQQIAYQYEDDKITVSNSDNTTYYYTDKLKGKLTKIEDKQKGTIKEFSYYPEEQLPTGVGKGTYASDIGNAIYTVTDETGMVTTYTYETKDVQMSWQVGQTPITVPTMQDKYEYQLVEKYHYESKDHGYWQDVDKYEMRYVTHYKTVSEPVYGYTNQWDYATGTYKSVYGILYYYTHDVLDYAGFENVYIGTVREFVVLWTEEVKVVDGYSWENVYVGQQLVDTVVGYNPVYETGSVKIISKTTETKTDVNGNNIQNTYNIDFNVIADHPFQNEQANAAPYYIEKRRITNTIENGQKSTSFEYHTDNITLKSITDIHNNTTQYLDLNDVGNYRKIVNPDGSYKLYDYDEQGNLIFEQDENENVTLYINTYDGYSLTKSEKIYVKDNSIWQKNNDDGNRPIKNDFGQPVISDRSAEKCSITTTEYTASGIKGLISKITSSEGIVTEYEYNNLGQLCRVLNCDADNNPNNLKTNYSYNLLMKDTETGIIRELAYGNAKNDNEVFSGSKVTQTSPVGYITERTFNVQGLETETAEYGKTGNKSITKTVYDATGKKIQEINPNSFEKGTNGTTYQYLGNSSLVSITSDSEGNTTSYEYNNPFNKKSKEILPNGAIYRYVYDVSGELQKTYYANSDNAAENLIEEYVADENGNTSELRDTQEKLNVDGLTDSYLITNGSKTVRTLRKYYAINSDGTTDTSKYNETKYVFDYKNKLVKTKNPDGTTIEKSYNKNGTVASEKNAGEYVTYYTYDINKQVIEKWEQLDTAGFTYSKYFYDNDGKLISEITKRDTVSYPEKPNIISANNLSTNEYFVKRTTYYANGKPHTERTSDGGLKTYNYDADGNVIRLTEKTNESEDNITEYSYSVNKKAEKPDSKTITVNKHDLYGYSDNIAGTIPITTDYSYDKNGNLISEIKTAYSDGNISYPQIIRNYVYDTLDRQISEAVTETTGEIVKTEKTYDYMNNLISETDAKGTVTSNTYDGRGNLLKTVKHGNDGEKIFTYTYDLANRKIIEVTPKNYSESDISTLNRKVYTYDCMGRVITESVIYKGSIYDGNDWTNPQTTTVTAAYKYDGLGNVIKSINAEEYAATSGENVNEKIENSHGKEFSYNAKKLVTSEKIPVAEGAEEQLNTYTYDALGNKTSDIASGETVKSYTYNGSGKLLKTMSGESILEENVYNLCGDLILHKDGNDNETSYTYNAFHKPQKMIQSGDESIDENIIVYKYDTSGREICHIDSTGVTVKTEYDNRGNIVRVETSKADEPTIINTKSYDKNGNISAESDGRNISTIYVYDCFDREISKSVGGHVSSKAYDKDDNILSETQIIGSISSTSSTEYDALGRAVKRINQLGDTIEILQYDLNSSQKYSYTPKDDNTFKKKEFKYNLNNQLISTTDECGNVQTQSYDKYNNVSLKNDGNCETTYVYDSLKHLLNVSAKIGNDYTTQSGYTYDNNGNMLTETNGNGNTTTYAYNTQNKVKSITYPEDSKVENYTYYADGLLKSKTDRNGVIASYTYNSLGKVKSEIVGNISRAYEYDLSGNQTQITENGKSIIRSFDALNRTLSKTESGATTNYEYDIVTTNGYLAEKSTDSFGNITQTVYDAAKRKAAVYDENNITASYDYYKNGSAKSVIYSNGTNEQYSYYDNGLTKSVVNNLKDMALERFIYTYDTAGNQLSKDETKDGVYYGKTIYTYDRLNRLVSVTEPSGKKTVYTYDLANNRQTQVVTQNGTMLTTTYVYNAQQWLMSETTSSGANEKITKYQYDNNGNLYSKTTESTAKAGASSGASLSILGKDAPSDMLTLYKYDELGRLTKVSSGDKITVNEYNGENKRILKAVNGVGKKYIYDGNNPVLELDGESNVTARNIYGKNLLSRTVGEEKAYYMYNANGDVTALTGSDGEMSASYSYDAFGSITDKTEYFDNPYKYAGYEYDNETGLYYCNARYYDPQIARFISQDTVDIDPNDPLSLNRYTYCFNNPLKYNDPSGNWPSLTKMFDYVNSYAQNFLSNIQSFAQNAYQSFNNNIVQPTKQFFQDNAQAIKTGAIAGGLIIGGTAIIAASGGTATPAVLAAAGTIAGGAAIGAGIDMYGTMIQDYATDHVFNYTAQQYTASAIRGGVSGGLMGVGGVFASGASLGATSVWNGASFMTGDVMSQQYQYGTVDYGKSAMYGITAGATSYAMGAIMPYAENAISSLGNKISNLRSRTYYGTSDIAGYKYNMIENPGPLASMKNNPAQNFYGGRYNVDVLSHDTIYYRAGQSGEPLGQWFSSQPINSVAQTRIDYAVKPQWIDYSTGQLTSTSTVNTLYAIKIPKGTTIYNGPVGYQGNVYLGGSNIMQTFIPEPWKLNYEVIRKTFLK